MAEVPISKDGDSASNKGGLKRRHLTVIGLVTIVSQFFVGMHGEKTARISVQEAVHDAVAAQVAPIQVEIANMRTGQEREFARKEELKELAESLSTKLDGVSSRLATMDGKVNRIEGYLKAKNSTYGALWNEDRR